KRVGVFLAGGGGDEHLFGARRDLHQRLAAVAIELGEDVVEDEDGVRALPAEEQVGGQAQGECEGPGFTVAGETLRRLVAQGERQIVAVRADNRTATLYFAVAAGSHLGEQHRLDDGRVLRDVAVERRAVGDFGGAGGGGERRIRLHDGRRQRADQRHTRGGDEDRRSDV